MDQQNFGEIFQRAPRRSSRRSRSSAQYRLSYNKDAVAPDIGEGDCGDANASSFPCIYFMVAAGIREDFLFLVNNAGLTTYMNDESHQYPCLLKSLLRVLISVMAPMSQLFPSGSMIGP